MRLRIEHRTTYTYARPVTLNRHRLVLRPREGHDQRVERMLLTVTPAHRVHWIRDVFGNSIALVDWLEPASQLQILNEVVVERADPFPERELHRPWTVPFPPAYESHEASVIAAYTQPTYPGDVPALEAWLREGPRVDPLDAEGTMLTLCKRVYSSVRYRRRMEKGVQSPAETLARGDGSCRDMATLLLDAARASGVGSRFASGYLHGRASLAGHASMHAWAEVYLPTLGWRGFDPTIGDVTSGHHIVTGVSSHPRGVMPVSGTFSGGSGDFLGLEVSVKTTVLDETAG